MQESEWSDGCSRCGEADYNNALVESLLFNKDLTKSGLHWWCAVVQSRSICRRKHPAPQKSTVAWYMRWRRLLQRCVRCRHLCSNLRRDATLTWEGWEESPFRDRRASYGSIAPCSVSHDQSTALYGCRIKPKSSQAW